MTQLSSTVLNVDTADDNKANAEAIENVLDATNSSIKGHSRVIRKLDWRIMPLISFLYLFSFIDRVNIGNARIVGMSTDLNLTGLRYNTAAAIFFIPYCLGQVPSNILLKFVRPSRWLPAIMIVWGLIMTLMCLVKTYHGLLAARFSLGLAEAGLFPGLAYYISLWYPRAEWAKRIAILVSASIVGSALSGPLAYAIVKMEGLGGLHGWQWIFCLEGLSTAAVAFIAFFFLPDVHASDPATASFLTAAERRYLIEFLKKDSQSLAIHYDFRFVLQALRDRKIYVQFIIYIGPGYGMALFLPTIINDLGFSATDAELLSAPPFVLKLRGPFVVAGSFVTLVGYIVLYTQTKPGISYFGNVLIALGAVPCIPINLAWISSNAGGEIKRGVAIAMVNGFGNLGGICASFIFFDPPRFHVGLTTIMVCLSLTILLSLFMMWDFNRLNKQRERMCHERGITEDHEEEFKESGDDSPLFRYAL